MQPHSDLPVAEHLLPFRAAAIDRLNYLFPELAFEESATGIRVRGRLSDAARRDIHYALHRAKIAVEAAPLRELLYRTALEP